MKTKSLKGKAQGFNQGVGVGQVPGFWLEVQVQHDVVLENGDEQHDAEAGEHAQVLQDKVTQVAALVVFTVTMEHLGQLVREGDGQ